MSHFIKITTLLLKSILCHSKGESGGQDPPENHKNIGFFSNTGPDPLRKATKPAFNVGPSSAASEMPFKCRFAGEPVMALS